MRRRLLPLVLVFAAPPQADAHDLFLKLEHFLDYASEWATLTFAVR